LEKYIPLIPIDWFLKASEEDILALLSSDQADNRMSQKPDLFTRTSLLRDASRSELVSIRNGQGPEFLGRSRKKRVKIAEILDPSMRIEYKPIFPAMGQMEGTKEEKELELMELVKK